MAHKKEVRGRGRHLKTLLAQGAGKPLATLDNPPAAGLEPFPIGVGGQRGALRDPVQGITVKTVFHALQGGYKRRRAQGQTHAQPGQRARLGQGLHDQQIGVIGEQGQRALPAEVDVGLIDKQQTLRRLAQKFLDLGKGQ